MANTYVKIYIHCVFAVKNRAAALPPDKRNDIYAYIGGILKRHNHIPLAIGGPDNHIHFLMEMNPNEKLSDTIRDVKAASSKYINDKRYIKCRFEWQRGYAALSYSTSQVPAVKNYINNQQEHHMKISLKDEIKIMLDRAGIEYEEGYLFDDV